MSFLSPTHEHLRGLCVVMVEEQAFARVERLDLSHIIGTQFKVKDVKFPRRCLTRYSAALGHLRACSHGSRWQEHCKV